MSENTITNLLKELKATKNSNVRSQIFKTLSALAKAIQFELDGYFLLIIPELIKSINDAHNIENILDSLMIMSRLFRSAKGKGVTKFHTAAKDICEMLKTAVDH